MRWHIILLQCQEHILKRILSAYKQGGVIGIIRRGALYGQRRLLAKAAPIIECMGWSRAILVQYVSAMDRRQHEDDTYHIRCLIGLSNTGCVIAAVPDYIAPFTRAIVPFAKKGLQLVDFKHAERDGTNALFLPFSLIHALDPGFINEVLEHWHIAAINHHAVTFSALPVALPVTDTQNVIQQIMAQLIKLNQIDREQGYTTLGGYTLQCRRNGFEIAMIDEVWKDYFEWGIEFRDNATIVDIGANIGAFTVEASRRAIKGRIIAFEPEPSNFELLHSNVKANTTGQVVLRQEAIGNRTGTVTLEIDTEHTGAHSIVSPKPMGAAKLTVPLVSFESVIAELGMIDVLKIDCEGAEYDILLSAPEALSKQVRQIIGEVQQTDRNMPAELISFLRNLGFQVEYKLVLST